jgi:hypothetical protein
MVRDLPSRRLVAHWSRDQAQLTHSQAGEAAGRAPEGPWAATSPGRVPVLTSAPWNSGRGGQSRWACMPSPGPHTGIFRHLQG